MQQLRRVAFCLIMLGVLVACAPEPPAVAETMQLEIVDLQVTPAVEHWLPRVAACAEGIPGFGIFTQVRPRADLSLTESDLILRLGNRLETDPFVAVIGKERIVIVAGEDVPVSSLSLERLQAIFAGEITHWGEVVELPDRAERKGTPIQVLAYPEGHEIQILFSQAFLEDEPVQAAAQVFSTVEFLQKMIEMYPNAIGYLLESQLPDGMRTLRLSPEVEINRGDQLVLAVAEREPEGQLRQWLLCLQN
jgi:hypothetical protein